MSNLVDRIFKSDLFALLVTLAGIAGMIYIMGWGNFMTGIESIKGLSVSLEWLRNLAEHGIV